MPWSKVKLDFSFCFDFPQSVSANIVFISDMSIYELQEHPRNLIPELSRLFYDLGWVTGTGGGISIKEG